MRCDECRFWKQQNTTVFEGECHRNPPVPVKIAYICSYWPRCNRDDWCGEFQAKETGETV